MCYYYLLGGDTAAPSRIYARLCHAFLVFVLLWKKLQTWKYPAYYLRTCLTDLDHIFSFDGHVGDD